MCPPARILLPFLFAALLWPATPPFRYGRALALEPEALHVLVRLAQIQDRAGEPSRALELWERVLRINPDHVEGIRRVRELRRERPGPEAR
jgi:cytochrome c-type biogenesis protein CcmH/NrfG